MLAALAAAAPPPRAAIAVDMVEAGGDMALLEDFLEGFEGAELELDCFVGLVEDLVGLVLPKGAATELEPETPPGGFGV